MFIQVNARMVDTFEGEDEDGNIINMQVDLSEVGVEDTEVRWVNVNHIVYVHPIDDGCQICTTAEVFDCANTEVEVMKKIKSATSMYFIEKN